MKKIKVLHIFDAFNQGGIENFVMNVYRNIDRKRIQFDFAFRYTKPGYFDKEAKELGGHIYYFLMLYIVTVISFQDIFSELLRNAMSQFELHIHMIPKRGEKKHYIEEFMKII